MIDAKSSRLSAAVALARRGFRVFPAIENDKRPLIDKWPDRASSDTAEISAVWTEYPAGNIGCFNDDLISLDVDVKDGKQGRRSLRLLEMLYETLPPTYVQCSASGGWHYTYRAPGEVVALIKTCADEIAGFSGIDVRAGRTGYIIGAGSSTAAGDYTVESDLPIADAPQWLLDLLPKVHDRKTQPNGDRQTPLVPLDAETAIARAIDWLEHHAPEAIEGAGGDHETLKVAYRVKDFGISREKCLELLLDHWNETKAIPPWDPDDLAVKVANAYRYGQNAPGIASAEAEFDAVEIDAKPSPKRKGLDVRNITSFGWSTAQGGYLVQGFLNYKMLAMMSAPSSAGKSPLALDLAAHIAMGRPWRGRKVKPAYVFHYSTEGFTGLSNRMEALRREHFEGLVNVPFDFVSGSLDLRRSTKDAEAITEAVRAGSAKFGVSPGLVVIDTLSHALGGGDDSNQEHVRAVLKNCSMIANATGAAVLILHHPTKSASSDYRGSSIMLNDIDLMIKVEVDPRTKKRTVTTPRVKEFAEIDPMHFNIKVVQLGEDEECDPITSIVVDWIETAEIEFEPKLTPPQAEVLAAFDDLIAKRNAAGEKSNATIATFSEWSLSLKHARAAKGVEKGEKPQLGRCLPVLIENGLVAKTSKNQYVRIMP